MKNENVSRRDFIATTGVLAGAMLAKSLAALTSSAGTADKKKRIAIVGTGSRAHGMWSKDVLQNYPDKVEFVGLCDINPGRVEYFKKSTGFTCPTFTDFEKMMKEVKPDTLIVTTVDATHRSVYRSRDGVRRRYYH